MVRSALQLALAAALLATSASCATIRRGAPADYSFSRAILNDRAIVATRAAARPATPRRLATPKPAPPVVAAPTKPARPSAPAKPTPVPAARPALSLASTGPALPESVAPEGGLGRGDRRSETIAAARRLLGMREAFDGRTFVHHLVDTGDIRLEGLSGKPSLRDVYSVLRASRLTYDRDAPTPGDLVFFHNTEDLDSDGRQNDWYSLAGVVEAVDPGGTVTVILPVDGEVGRRVLTLARPDVRRDEAGSLCNDVLRQKRLGDPPHTQYLAGQLYAGFAALPE